MRSDPMCWQLALPEGKSDTAKHRNQRFGRMDKPRDIKFTSRGAGMVHDGKPNINRSTYEARRVAICTTRVYDTSPDATLIRVDDGARISARARKLRARALDNRSGQS